MLMYRLGVHDASLRPQVPSSQHRTWAIVFWAARHRQVLE